MPLAKVVLMLPAVMPQRLPEAAEKLAAETATAGGVPLQLVAATSQMPVIQRLVAEISATALATAGGLKGSPQPVVATSQLSSRGLAKVRRSTTTGLLGAFWILQKRTFLFERMMEQPHWLPERTSKESIQVCAGINRVIIFVQPLICPIGLPL